MNIIYDKYTNLHNFLKRELHNFIQMFMYRIFLIEVSNQQKYVNTHSLW